MAITAPEPHASGQPSWRTLAGWLAVPFFVVPLAFRGLRGLHPRILREATGGAIVLGLVSLAGIGLQAVAGRKRAVPASQPCVPQFGLLLPDELCASAASAY